MSVEQTPIQLPTSGLIATRIALEYGGSVEFSQALERAQARGGEEGATIIAFLDRGDISIHLPREDGPCWNAVPLVHLQAGLEPSPEDWATANAVLEKLERYR